MYAHTPSTVQLYGRHETVLNDIIIHTAQHSEAQHSTGRIDIDATI
jgi:hypothetical protein